MSPSLPGGRVGRCAVRLWGGLGASDGGYDGSAGCKAHGCGLLVKGGSSALPSLCHRSALICRHSSGSELRSYRSLGLPFAALHFPGNSLQLLDSISATFFFGLFPSSYLWLCCCGSVVKEVVRTGPVVKSLPVVLAAAVVARGGCWTDRCRQIP